MAPNSLCHRRTVFFYSSFYRCLVGLQSGLTAATFKAVFPCFLLIHSLSKHLDDLLKNQHSIINDVFFFIWLVNMPTCILAACRWSCSFYLVSDNYFFSVYNSLVSTSLWLFPSAVSLHFLFAFRSCAAVMLQTLVVCVCLASQQSVSIFRDLSVRSVVTSEGERYRDLREEGRWEKNKKRDKFTTGEI